MCSSCSTRVHRGLVQYLHDESVKSNIEGFGASLANVLLSLQCTGTATSCPEPHRVEKSRSHLHLLLPSRFQLKQLGK